MKKIFIILTLIMSLNFVVSAQGRLPQDATSDVLFLDANTAVDLAMKNNLGIESERLKLQQKTLQTYTNWNVFIPTVTLTGSLTKLNQINTTVPNTYYPISAYGNTMGYPVIPVSYDNTGDWNVGMKLDISLALNAAMGFAVYATTLDYKNSKLSLEMATKKLNRDVKKNYYSLIILQKNIQNMRDNIDSAKKRYDQTVANYNSGLVAEYQKLGAEVAYENLKPALLEMENGYNIALLSFKQMIGIKSEIELNFVETINIDKKIYDSKVLIEKYLDNKLELQSLNINKLSLENLRNIYISQMTPSFVIGWSYDPTFQRSAFKYNWFNDTNTASNKFKTDLEYTNYYWKQRSGMFMMAVSIPLNAYFPFSKEQMNIINNEYTIKQMNIGIQQAKQGTELEIKATVNKLNKSVKNIDALKLNVQLAEKAYRMAEESYRAGSKDLLEVENANNELKKAQTNLLSEQINYVTALLDLEYTTNTSLK
jgi:outer membrane protein TolC